MNVLYRIFWYLKCELSRIKNPNAVTLVYEAHHTVVDYRIFPQSTQDQWNDFYPDGKELLQSEMPKPRGFYVKIRTYVDADNSGNLEIWMSHTGCRVY